MEPEEIIKRLLDKMEELSKETKILYELSKIEEVLVHQIMRDLASNGIPPVIAAKVLKATAHLIEQVDDIKEDIIVILDLD